MLEPYQYTVGWITALPLENTAAYTCLDKVHPDLTAGHARDNNLYTLGEIAGHNVVIACLPVGQYGLSSATRVGQDMLRTFPNIRLGLMVGIGAGAPSKKHDIRLGDVVVSAPANNGYGGVLQFDFGKLHDNGSFDLTKHLNQPPPIFMTAVGSLITEYEIHGRRLDLVVEETLRRYENLSEKYQRPDGRSDRLYRSDYLHSQPGLECDECCDSGEENLQKREERSARFKVKIHHGLIASSNQLLKNAEVRDKWASKAGVLCFEMEAAGLMNDFPCVVVRGICDYADSHKNDAWQGYAAMTAAAYAKELLQKIPVTAVKEQSKIAALEKQVLSLSKYKRIKWLRLPDYRSNLEHAKSKRLPGTGNWFIESNEYQDWRKQQTSLLSLRGSTGCGKTVLSSVAIEDLSMAGNKVVFFFFDSRRPADVSAFNSNSDASNQSYSENEKTSACSMIRSLIYQFLEIDGTNEEQDALFGNFGNGTNRPFADQVLMPFFERMAERRKDIWMVLDAIDECLDPLAILDWIQHLSSNPELNLHVIITNRTNYDIHKRIDCWSTPKYVVEVVKDKIQPDIDLFIQWSLEEIKKYRKWDDNDEVGNIRNDLKEKSTGMFMLVVCQLDILKTCDTTEEAGRVLKTFPIELSEIYNRILKDIRPHKLPEAIRLLQLLTYSDWTLRLDEVSEAISVDPQQRMTQGGKRSKSYSLIASYCSTFLQISNNSEDPEGMDEGAKEIQFAHPSIKEHLLSLDLEEFFRVHLEKQAANSSLTLICINYLFGLDESLSFESIKRDYPFALYASSKWLHHAGHSVHHVRGLRQHIIDFLESTKFIYALQISDPEFGSRTKYSPSYDRYEAGGTLYYTCRVGLVYEAKYFLQQNSDPNAEGGKFGTPLTAACHAGSLDVVQLLVNYNAHINPMPRASRRDRIGEGHFGSPLQAACWHNHRDIIEYLLRNGAHGNFRNGRFGSALQAIAFNGEIKVLEMLLDAGASINEVGGSYATAIQAAASENHLETVQSLLRRGADPNLKGGFYGTPLYAAAFHGHASIVEELIKGNADINIQGNNELDPLFMAFGYTDKVMKRIFNDDKEFHYMVPALDLLIDTNKPKIRAPLYGAAVAGHKGIVKRLLTADAEPNTRCGMLGSPLIAAAFQGQKEIVEILLERGAQVDLVAGHWGTALQAAAYNGNDSIVNLLLENGAEINQKAGQYQTALQAACAEGKIETVRLLLERGADLNICGEYGSPLQAALIAGREDIFDLLLKEGAEVNVQCGWYGNALQAASFLGYTRTVYALIHSKLARDVNAYGGVYGTALFAAASSGHYHICCLLLDHGADVNGRGGSFRSCVDGMDVLYLTYKWLCTVHELTEVDPVSQDIYDGKHRTRFCPKVQEFGSILSGASGNGHVEIVKLLLSRGADINSRGGIYGSALHEAVCKKQLTVVELLLQSDADVEIKDKDGATPLIKATENEDLAMVQLLLTHQAKPNEPRSSGETPLHISVLGEDESIMKLLLSEAADVSSEGAGLGTPLFRSALIGSISMVKCLLDVKDINVNHGGRNGTPLAAASFAGHEEVVELLRSHGATIDDGGDWNQALTSAASLGYTAMAKILIEGGADIDSQDEDSISAINLARRYGHQEIVDLLREQDADETLNEAVLGEAVEYYTELLEAAKGDDDSRTIKIMTTLSYLLVNPEIGDTDKAIDLLTSVVESASKRFGNIAPETTSALTDLGMALASGGYIDRATETLEQATQGYIRAYGVTEEIKNYLWLLAMILAWQGEIDAAFKVLAEAYLEPNDFAMLDRRVGKALMEKEIGKYFRARVDPNVLI